MTRDRRTALVAGLLYLLTVVTSVPALVLKSPVLHDPAVLASPGAPAAVLWACALEVALALCCVGTAVVLFPVVKRVDEALALGFVAARCLEACLVLTGVLALLALVTTSSAPDAAVRRSLVALHDGAFLVGPGFVPAVNALLLGSLLLRSRLVPRAIPIVGLVGAPLLVGSAAATLFGLLDQVSPLAGLAALPVAVWEVSLGVWLVVKGFRPAALPDGARHQGGLAGGSRAAGVGVAAASTMAG